MTTASVATSTDGKASRKRGLLRVYLGAAPGVGKTYAMLSEGRRAKERGRDVVVGFVEAYGRPRTEEAIGDLEVIPRKQMAYRGTGASSTWAGSSTRWPAPTWPPPWSTSPGPGTPPSLSWAPASGRAGPS
jgi:two-component system, OmpR family, sensor histidine kinase KdpD